MQDQVTPKELQLVLAGEIRKEKELLLVKIFESPEVSLGLCKVTPEDVCCCCFLSRAEAQKSPSAARTCSKCKRIERHKCNHETDVRFAFDLSKGLSGKSSGGAKTNMDIFTAQQIASKRAKHLADRINEPQCVKAISEYRLNVKRLLDKYQEDAQYKLDSSDLENTLIQLVVVGASVTSLTFHATLAELLSKSNTCKFDELFNLSFIDVYEQPLGRLMQARDRTIVPRYEYERLFETPLSGVKPELCKDVDSKYFDKWLIRNPGFMPDNESQTKWQATHEYMPSELRWQPGTVREVAHRINDGYVSWLKKSRSALGDMDHESYLEQTMSYMGRWFKGIEPPSKEGDGDAQYRPSTAERCLFGVAVNECVSIRNEQLGRNRSSIHGDVLLLAKGLGIDIPGDYVDKLEQREKVFCNGKEDCSDTGEIFDFPSVQRSYWDTSKSELDIPETQSEQILIVGNSDAAAGALFANLLVDFDSCSFKLLSELIWVCGKDGELLAPQKWFRALQSSVNNFLDENVGPVDESVTSKWLRALRSEGVLDSLHNTRELLKGDEIDKHLRSRRTIHLGIKYDKEDYEAQGELLDQHFQMKAKGINPLNNPYERFLRMKFMNNAWPENQLLSVLLKHNIDILYLDYGIPFDITYNRGRKKSTFKITGNVTQTSFNSGELKSSPDFDLELKYVINCGGPAYFQKDGNLELTV